MKQTVLLITASAYTVAGWGQPWALASLGDLLGITSHSHVDLAAEEASAVEAHRRRSGNAWSSGAGNPWSSGNGNAWSSGNGNAWNSGNGNPWGPGSGSSSSEDSGSGSSSSESSESDSTSESGESESPSESGESESQEGSNSESGDSESQEGSESESGESESGDSEPSGSESGESESAEPSGNGNDGKSGNSGNSGNSNKPKAEVSKVVFEVRMCCMSKTQCEASGAAMKVALSTTKAVTTTCTLVEDKKKTKDVKRRLANTADKSTWDVKYEIEADKETAPKYEKALKTAETRKKLETAMTAVTGGTALEKFEVKEQVSSPKDAAGEGMSGGAIAGIVIGVLLGLGCIGGGIYYYMKQ